VVCGSATRHCRARGVKRGMDEVLLQGTKLGRGYRAVKFGGAPEIQGGRSSAADGGARAKNVWTSEDE
jgi:hypothetical protein